MRLLCAFLLPLLAFSVDWKPLPPDLLTLAKPRIDADASAEAIFWEAWVDDTISGNFGTHKVTNYMRIKLFTDRGVERHGNVEIPYYTGLKMSVTEIKGRTIQPDGIITELKKDSIFDSVKAKTGRKQFKSISFAMPALKPGVIIEYQWTEVYTETLLDYVRLPVQREIPAWEVIYHVRPINDPRFPYQMRAFPFNCQPSTWEPSSTRGFLRTQFKDVRAFEEEPRMPAEDDVKAWLLLYYTEDTQEKPDKYWKSLAKKLHDEFKHDSKANDAIKKKAAELNGDLSALADFSRTKIKNVSYRTNNVTAEDRAALKKPNENPGDTLKNGIGTPHDINMLFAALAFAAGHDVYYARAGSSNSALVRRDMMNRYLLRNEMVVIKKEGGYMFFNPGVPYVTPGMLDWDEEGQPAVVSDSKGPGLITLPFSKPEDNVLFRTAKFTLTAEGALSGTVTLNYNGQHAVSRKRYYEDLSDAERVEELRETLTKRFPGATVSALKIDNAAEPNGPVKVSYGIDIPHYAERTGKRMFFGPGFFQLGEKALFANAKRRYPIAFRHATTERDEIAVELPPGYALENPEMPGTIKLGQVGEYSMIIKTNQAKTLLIVNRELVWGHQGSLYFPTEAYPQLKAAWEKVNEGDKHMLTLRQAQ